jgi:hypothetical protein
VVPEGGGGGGGGLWDVESQQDASHPLFKLHVGASATGGGGGGESGKGALAGIAPSSVGDILARVYNLVISFFTNAYIQIVMGPDPSPDVFFVYFAVMVLVLMFYDTARAIIVRMGDRDQNWNATLVSVLDFLTITLVFIVFQTAPVLALQYWTRAGMSAAETIVLPVLAIVSVFAAYHYICGVAKKGA